MPEHTWVVPFAVKGVGSVWTQVLVQAIGLQFARQATDSYWVPVFGGDFNDHVIFHHSVGDSSAGEQLHVMQHKPTSEDRNMAMRCMKFLVQQSAAASESCSDDAD